MEKVTLTKDGVTYTVSDEMFIRALKNEGFKTPEELAKDQPQEETAEEETEQPEEVADVE
ncbi:hypothetical protein [uncultured Granulicatella sp.]|uniref:hypothetical protein n=1 Tax=uncultured Granulicatella sp. TaxID=316089 RepID=UPI0028D66E2C|nr:hypothetical protein [uncultured Granulicatella sp.]